MNSIESQFVPYEIAVKLKELGFDNICITKYGMSSKRFYDNYKPYKNSDNIYPDSGTFCNDLVAAPLYQQAFDYIRENGFDGEIYPNASGYCWTISKSAFNPRNNISGGTHVCDYDMQGPNSAGGYDTYESARLACLEKLIELVTEKKG